MRGPYNSLFAQRRAFTMPAQLIDGVLLSKQLREDIAARAAKLTAAGKQPGLAVILVGEDPASQVYVRNKVKACGDVGFHSVLEKYEADLSEQALLDRIAALNADPAIHGILVQMPLPKQIDPDAVILRIRADKDVDGFHPVNVGKLLIGDRTGFVSCTPAGVMELLARSEVMLKGCEAVVIGRSNIVGKPMAALLVQPGVDATVTVCHSRTRDLATHVRGADVVIAAVGRPEMITGDMLKPGAVVIDVGINRVDDPTAKKGYRLVGDVHFESARRVASQITPVPGGVGPMTIAMLMQNTVRAAAQIAGVS